jgi:hypothetical protein
MYPTFCSYRTDTVEDEPDFSTLAKTTSPGPTRPGLAVFERDDHIEVLVAPNGRTISLPCSAVRLGLSELVALAMMDAVEEAIEDARDEVPSDAQLIARLETTLNLLEQALDA